MKIVLMEPLGITSDSLNFLVMSLIERGHEFLSYDTKTTVTSELIQRGKDADVIIIANNPLPRDAILGMTKLKFISVAFVGIDHVDKDTCIEKGISISNASGYCKNAVAELAIGLTLSVLRNIPKCDIATRSLQTRNNLVGRELHGKTFGIIGTGEIGLRTAEIAKVFGCKIVGYSRTKKSDALKLGLEYLSLDDLLSQSDIISIHTPLTEETKYLINKEQISKMKPTSILINTARGQIVDSKALTEALNEGKIAGAGIDVFDIEPALKSDDLYINTNNTVLTPHVAFATDESMIRRAHFVFDNITSWEDKNPIRIML